MYVIYGKDDFEGDTWIQGYTLTKRGAERLIRQSPKESDWIGEYEYRYKKIGLKFFRKPPTRRFAEPEILVPEIEYKETIEWKLKLLEEKIFAADKVDADYEDMLIDRLSLIEELSKA